MWISQTEEKNYEWEIQNRTRVFECLNDEIWPNEIESHLDFACQSEMGIEK